jgi:GAF domain-containing protein
VYAMETPDAVMVVPDATLDHRFSTNAMVISGPGYRFYAGVRISFHSSSLFSTFLGGAGVPLSR